MSQGMTASRGGPRGRLEEAALQTAACRPAAATRSRTAATRSSPAALPASRRPSSSAARSTALTDEPEGGEGGADPLCSSASI